MSDSELLAVRVRVQRAIAVLSRPRTERDERDVTAALEEIDAALRTLARG